MAESCFCKKGDFQQMSVRTISDMTYWSALALSGNWANTPRQRVYSTAFTSIRLSLEAKRPEDRIFCYLVACHAAVERRPGSAQPDRGAFSEGARTCRPGTNERSGKRCCWRSWKGISTTAKRPTCSIKFACRGSRPRAVKGGARLSQARFGGPRDKRWERKPGQERPPSCRQNPHSRAFVGDAA